MDAPGWDSVGPAPAKLPLDADGAVAILRLGRWMRIVGTIQVAMAGMGLLFLLLGTGCGAMIGGPVAMLVMLLPLAAVGVYLLQGLRTQAAGEQLKNLAEAMDVDYLELVFARLRTVFIIDVVIAVLMALNGGFSS